ncbi:hypothetical protein ILYODFUR_026330 [Ilyodon furcidens]|uniref:Uncharacterized protein n=1 Tax=Ilyodon furcidens TaxID=33524 RepID=A0ABV0U8L4_9TELE
MCLALCSTYPLIPVHISGQFLAPSAQFVRSRTSLASCHRRLPKLKRAGRSRGKQRAGVGRGGGQTEGEGRTERESMRGREVGITLGNPGRGSKAELISSNFFSSAHSSKSIQLEEERIPLECCHGPLLLCCLRESACLLSAN